MIASIQKLLDTTRVHNDEARALAKAAADLEAERHDLIGKFKDLGISKPVAAQSIVSLSVKLVDVAMEAVPELPSDTPAAVDIPSMEVTVVCREGPSSGAATQDALEPPAFLDRRKGAVG